MFMHVHALSLLILSTFQLSSTFVDYNRDSLFVAHLRGVVFYLPFILKLPMQ
jgi:hypothetical protein